MTNEQVADWGYIIRTETYRDDRGVKLAEHAVVAGLAPDDFPRFTVTMTNVPIAQDIKGNQVVAPGPFIIAIPGNTLEEAFTAAPAALDNALAMLRKKGAAALQRSALTTATPAEVLQLGRCLGNGR